MDFSKTFNKQIQRIYDPHHSMFVFKYMSYHETSKLIWLSSQNRNKRNET